MLGRATRNLVQRRDRFAHDECSDLTSGCGARVSWETPAGPRSGITAGVDEHGALLVDAGDRMERIVAGELRWL